MNTKRFIIVAVLLFSLSPLFCEDFIQGECPNNIFSNEIIFNEIKLCTDNTNNMFKIVDTNDLENPFFLLSLFPMNNIFNEKYLSADYDPFYYSQQIQKQKDYELTVNAFLFVLSLFASDGKPLSQKSKSAEELMYEKIDGHEYMYNLK